MAAGVDHVAWTLPELDPAIDLLRDAFGAELLFRYERRPAPGDTAFAERMDASADAWYEVAMVRLPGGGEVELFRFHAADQRGEGPRNSDVGGTHLALRVDDLDDAMERLRGRTGLRPAGPVLELPRGPLAGMRSAFWHTAWGWHLELVERPS
jgi:glyoxylase I family protein